MFCYRDSNFPRHPNRHQLEEEIKARQKITIMLKKFFWVTLIFSWTKTQKHADTQMLTVFLKKTVCILSRITFLTLPGQIASSNESPGHFFPPPVGCGLVQDLVRTFLFPPQSPAPHPLHPLHGDQLPSTANKRDSTSIARETCSKEHQQWKCLRYCLCFGFGSRMRWRAMNISLVTHAQAIANSRRFNFGLSLSDHFGRFWC